MKDSLIQTGSQTVGPFFHYALVVGDENILVNETTRGQPIRIEGIVYDGENSPVPDALIEIWQADTRGYFNHPADPNHSQTDPAFRGYGRAATDRSGVYFFKTVKPGAIARPENPPHAPYIDVRVFARGMLIHVVTRLYFGDEPANATDTVLASLDPTRRQSLIAEVGPSGEIPCYRFDIRLQGEGETIFFNP
jgi:protocatechuate 3,4-dioxygenase alpha subunit